MHSAMDKMRFFVCYDYDDDDDNDDDNDECDD